MKLKKLQILNLNTPLIAIILLTSITNTQTATIKDVFITNIPEDSPRVARDSKYYIDRHSNTNQRDISTSRLLKPEDSPEARESQTNTGIEKRCTRCDGGYSDYRGGSSSYRSDSRYQDPRYDSRKYYDDRYDSFDRYDPYDSYYDSYDRDRYRRPSYRDEYDRYEPRYYDKYDRYNRDRSYDRSYDRGTGYDRGTSYDRGTGYDRGAGYDRGIGYDNVGYDYRGSDRNSYRPYDETYRGVSGWDTSGRGYYFNRGSPETSGKWGTYASSWGYGRGDDRGDRGYRDQGYRGSYRPRDYFSYGTSYLYGRPSSSTTTSIPSNSQQDSDNSVTDTPSDTSG